MATASTNDGPIEYTVKQTAKIHQEKPIDPRPSVWLSVAKWVVAIFLFLAVLFCVTASKISLLSVAGPFKGENRETVFIMMVVILMVPQGFAFLRSCWGSLFRSSHPWPSNKALCVGLAASVMEVLGLCYFTIVVLPNTIITADLCVLMMNGVFFASAFWQIWLTQSVRNRIMFSLVAVAEIVAIAVLAYKIYIQVDKADVAALVPIALLLLSMAWCPKVSKLQLEPRGGFQDNIDDDISVATENGTTTRVQGESNQINMERHHKTARGKATIITSFQKLILTPFIAAAFCHWLDNGKEYQPSISLSKLQKGFNEFNSSHPSFDYFMVQIFTSLFGYLLGWFACGMRLQRFSFALPLTLTTPLAMVVVLVPRLCGDSEKMTHFKCGKASDPYIIPLAVVFFAAQFFSTNYYVWKKEGFILAKESAMFWLPTYNGVLLEQNLLLNRKNEITDECYVNQRHIAENSHVFICTTMYHEAEHEMEQLLNSIHDIDTARKDSQRSIESHIWFDGAVKGETCNNYVLQLIGLVNKALKVNMESCTKMKTPYGIELRWRLPGGMYFHIHLKDNLKVKNKKRWSQVMYMSYVLDYKKKQLGIEEDNTYILTTDADVQFTHTSVEALLDLMMRDPRVGAVCGRTHPLGVGPLVWYQVFDYAIGHWFQKVANHVLGSVLCCPGCFSVYRVSAIRDILPIYSTGVDNSFDFLTKDMGEDRWLCTLMVQSGWKLEYCAAAEDHTFCPDDFNEFFNQRRRWIPSTMANLIVLISQWKIVIENNDLISFLFILYQGLIVFSTIICPATVILIMVGGLAYANLGLDQTAILVVLCTITVLFAIICLYTSQDFQLKVAYILTIVFALLMACVAVGTAASIGLDLAKRSSRSTNNTSHSKPTNVSLFFDRFHIKPLYINGTDKFYMNPLPDLPPLPNSPVTMPSYLQEPKQTTPTPFGKYDSKLPAAVSTLYLAGLVAIFLLAALLHPFEAYCLLHGFWYLLSLPSGYLLLIIYSVCNMTDRSWGTREEKTKKVDDEEWYETLWKKLKYIFTCCREQPPPQPPGSGQQPVQATGSADELSDVSTSPITSEDDEVLARPSQEVENATTPSEGAAQKELPKSVLKPSKLRKAPSFEEESKKSMGFRYPGEKKVTFAPHLPKLHSETPVEEWLQGDMEDLYLDNFKRNGYDNISFIAGMTDKDLRDIGITTRGHRKRILYAVEKIPNVEIEQNVPENVEEWLHDIGLEMYWGSFKEAGYTEARMLEDLKGMTKELLEQNLHVHKIAHLNKLYNAIKKLRYPTQAQRRIRAARNSLKEVPFHDLRTDNYDDGKEFEFWEGLRNVCLLPESQIFGGVAELKEKLSELRDKALMVFAVANALWIILIVVLIKRTELNILGTNVLGLAFLCVYGSLIVIQFITLLWHRLITMSHVLARAPWKRGPLQMNYAFSNANLPPDPDPTVLEEIRNKRRRRRTKATKRRLSRAKSQSSQSLLADSDFTSSGSHDHRDYNTFNDSYEAVA